MTGRALYYILALGLAGAASTVNAQDVVTLDEGDRRNQRVTVYTAGPALVHETRLLSLKKGTITLKIEDIAPSLLPHTVRLDAGQGRHVIEQSFDRNTLTPRTLLERSVGERVKIYRTHPQTGEDSEEDARILSVEDGVVVEINGRIEVLSSMPGRIVFPHVPDDLSAKPVLSARLDVASKGKGEQPLELLYQADGLSWTANYTAVISADGEQRLDLEGWVNLFNDSGLDFYNSKIEVVAGDINRVDQQSEKARFGAVSVERAALADASITPQSVTDLYLYALPGAISIKDGSSKQIGFVSTSVSVQKHLSHIVNGFYTAEDASPVSVSYVFENQGDGKEARPLPAGVVRLYAAAGDNLGPRLVGEDYLAHAASGETVSLDTGRAFDVKVLAKTVDRTIIENTRDRRIYDVTQSYVVTNASDDDVSVELVQHVPAQGWSLRDSSIAVKNALADRALWDVPVPAGKSTELRFTMRVEN